MQVKRILSSEIHSFQLATMRPVCYNSEARFGARGAGAAQVAIGYFRDLNS
jgi:hypothetical protein